MTPVQSPCLRRSGEGVSSLGSAVVVQRVVFCAWRRRSIAQRRGVCVPNNYVQEHIPEYLILRFVETCWLVHILRNAQRIDAFLNEARLHPRPGRSSRSNADHGLADCAGALHHLLKRMEHLPQVSQRIPVSHCFAISVELTRLWPRIFQSVPCRRSACIHVTSIWDREIQHRTRPVGATAVSDALSPAIVTIAHADDGYAAVGEEFRGAAACPAFSNADATVRG